MASRNSIGIIGAGLSGLVLGRALKARGLPAVVFERSQDAAAARHSYSITLLSSAYEPLLHLLGMDFDSFRRQVALDKSPIPEVDPKKTGLRVNRGRLEQLLEEQLDIQWNRSLVESHSTEDTIHLKFKDGSPFDTDLVVGCDGPVSTFRPLIAPNSPLKVHPFVVFNGKRHMKRDEFELIAKYFKGVNEVQSMPANVLLQAYINDSVAQSGQDVSISYTYSRPARGPNDPCHKPDRPTSGATKIPAEFWTELDAIQGELVEPFKTIFDKESVEDDRLLHWLMRSVMVSQDDIEKALRMHGVMIGDCLHATPILGSLGANLAIRDSLELATCIAGEGDLHENLKRFYAERYSSWARSVKDGEQRLAKMHESSAM